MNNQEILKVINVSKTFIGVKALTNVSMNLLKGEVHALVGENGAGKSTLSKIICGAYGYDSGEIIYKNKSSPRENPKKIQDLGIFMIPQDLGLIPNITAMQNIFLGRESRKLGIIDLKYCREMCQKILDDMGVKLDLDVEVNKLPIEQQQFVAIARVLSAKAELIILDEPTSTLSESEVNNLFRIIGNLKKRGITIVYISHRIEEIFQIADRVTVLKDGFFIKTSEISKTNKNEIVRDMVGRSLSNVFPPKRKEKIGKCIMRLENVSVLNKLYNLNLDIIEGEVLGIGGLVGMGQTALINSIFGKEKISNGTIIFKDNKLSKLTPSKAIFEGINFISSDRRGEMLFMCRSIQENISIATLKYRQKSGIIDLKSELKEVNDQIDEYKIVSSGKNQEVQFLSGGNQQKTILARWLIRKPKVLLLNEPTQGIDVGTKEYIYKKIRELANEGLAVVIIFSDMMELLGMCDRIVVMYEGKISKIFSDTEATEEKIMEAASTIKID